jgi:hypothetical protein
MARHLLSDRRVRTAKPAAKPYRLHDGDGLALRISPSGAHSWQFRYTHNGTWQTATLGRLDLLTLAEARAKAEELRKLADRGEHLTIVKRAARLQRQAEAANRFDVVAARWIEREARRQRWTSAYRREVAACIRRGALAA